MKYATQRNATHAKRRNRRVRKLCSFVQRPPTQEKQQAKGATEITWMEREDIQSTWNTISPRTPTNGNRPLFYCLHFAKEFLRAGGAYLVGDLDRLNVFWTFKILGRERVVGWAERRE